MARRGSEVGRTCPEAPRPEPAARLDQFPAEERTYVAETSTDPTDPQIHGTQFNRDRVRVCFETRVFPPTFHGLIPSLFHGVLKPTGSWRPQLQAMGSS
ncbi:hypothetical protein EYF80_041600 [Liparis tanakae]|uniref:Uncharacterized protein n=1 Tax=Liparis tanakae TaxID=230148 RepID=A0A4Z2G3S6_9TELE|nr:hypothetical protein EYF80_041600 [Liparis tanakae]